MAVPVHTYCLNNSGGPQLLCNSMPIETARQMQTIWLDATDKTQLHFTQTAEKANELRTKFAPDGALALAPDTTAVVLSAARYRRKYPHIAVCAAFQHCQRAGMQWIPWLAGPVPKSCFGGPLS